MHATAEPEGPVRRRRALLVATAAYSDAGLAALRAPTGDVDALAEVLGNGSIGEFEVTRLVDRPTETLKMEIEGFFGQARREDLLLLYFSCHGVLSQSRRFYFATATTALNVLRSTAIEDSFVNDVMQHSRARSIVLILDCCHSGAFGKGLRPKSALTVDVEHRFEGHGRVTLSASTALEYAFEEANPATGISELEPAAPGSLFTRCLVEGLASGAADIDGDGDISVDELYDYVCQRMRDDAPHQTPGMAGDVRGEIIIARSPRRVALPPELASAVRSNLAGIRAGAVSELASLAATGPPALARVAREALHHLAGDDSRSVSAAAQAALGERPAPPSEPPAPEPPLPAERALPPATRRRRLLWPAAAGTAIVAVAAIAAVLLVGGDPEPRAASPAAYDFDGDGSQEIVLGAERGTEHDGVERAGTVAVHPGPGKGAARLISATVAGVPGPHQASDRFGASIAGGDFNGDGMTDLAIGAPGRDVVSVLYGKSGAPDRVSPLFADRLEQPPAVSGFGSALTAADMNRDGYADLAVGTPGTPAELEASDAGAVHVFLGGSHGLTTARARRLEPPTDFEAGFGRFLATGDVDGDSDVDLVEGTMDEPDLAFAGHGSFCAGTPDGPRTCRQLGPDDRVGTSALAVGDVNGDRFADVVQGDKINWDGRPKGESEYQPAEVRVWLGARDGPSDEPLVLAAGMAVVPIPEEEGDDFAHDVEAGDVDGDRLADIIVGARWYGEHGAVGVIRGARSGFARSGNFRLEHDPELGKGFGETLSLLDLNGDGRLDLVVGVGEAPSADEAIEVYMGSPDGLRSGKGLGGLSDLMSFDDPPLLIGR